jgi:hypothetical protein
VCVCSTGNEDERAVVGPTEEELKDECTGRSGGGKMRIVPVPARAQGLPSRLSETNDDNNGLDYRVGGFRMKLL